MTDFERKLSEALKRDALRWIQRERVGRLIEICDQDELFRESEEKESENKP